MRAIAHWIEEGKVISMTSDIVTSEFDAHYSREYAAMIREQNNRKNLIKGFSVFLQNVISHFYIFRISESTEQLLYFTFSVKKTTLYCFSLKQYSVVFRSYQSKFNAHYSSSKETVLPSLQILSRS